jgi:ankyrin repeat protein
MPKKSSKKSSKQRTPAAETTLVPHRAPNLTDLLERAQRGKLSDVKQYLSAGGLPNVLVPLQSTFGFGTSPAPAAPLLCGVVESLHNEAARSVELLLQAGAAVDATFVGANGTAYTALQLASMHTTASATACLQALLKGGADSCYHTGNGMTALHYAAASGNPEGCRVLYAASSGRVLELECDFLCAPPLLLACTHNQAAAAKQLCELGADVNHRDSEGHTALIYAAERDVQLVQYLLERDSSNLHATTIRGDTALIAAALAGNYASVKLLLEHGADASILNHQGGSAIGAAATNGHLSVVKLLRRYGCEITAAAASGYTLLMLACRGGYEELAVFC